MTNLPFLPLSSSHTLHPHTIPVISLGPADNNQLHHPIQVTPHLFLAQSDLHSMTPSLLTLPSTNPRSLRSMRHIPLFPLSPLFLSPIHFLFPLCPCPSQIRLARPECTRSGWTSSPLSPSLIPSIPILSTSLPLPSSRDQRISRLRSILPGYTLSNRALPRYSNFASDENSFSFFSFILQLISLNRAVQLG